MHAKIVWEGETPFGRYQVADTTYGGRPARVLYGGDHSAAQSGLAQDDQPDLLFDYNQRLLELAEAIQPARVLTIGGAAGTLATALLARFPHVQIDIVEPDEALINLGHQFFGLPATERLRVFATDGRSFLRTQAETYDFIVLDAFMDATIPAGLMTIEAFAAMAQHLNPQGVLAMNIISGYYGPSAQVLGRVYAGMLPSFAAVDVFLAGHGYSLWLPQNFIVAAQKGTVRPLRDHMRYEAVKPPETHPGSAAHDASIS